MDPSSAAYTYHFANVALDSWGATNIMIFAFFLVAAVLSLLAGPYVYGFSIYRKKEAERAEKKRTIQNLLVMKDIQTELEEEMRRALTNANVTQ